MDRSWRVPGGAPALFTERTASLLRPEDQVFDEMLSGWRDQQLSRNLRPETIDNRLALIRRFQRFSAEYPWTWRPQDWRPSPPNCAAVTPPPHQVVVGDASVTTAYATPARGCRTTSIGSSDWASRPDPRWGPVDDPGRQCALRLFLEFASDSRYSWTSVCEQLFDNHPTQICFEWNTAQHSVNNEGRPQRRALTKAELQRFFDHCDAWSPSPRASRRRKKTA